jgi:hypothetical protein
MSPLRLNIFLLEAKEVLTGLATSALAAIPAIKPKDNKSVEEFLKERNLKSSSEF